MSMKFFAGLQDFLSFYDTSSSSNEQQQQEEQLASSTSTTAQTPTAVVVATSSSLLPPPSVSPVNSNFIESDENSVRYISDISKNRIAVQDKQQQLHLQKVTLDDSKGQYFFIT